MRLHRACWLISALVSAAALPAPARGVGLTKFIEKDTISVMAEGMGEKERFAVVFSRKAGSIAVWHDLAADPKMEVNLSARGEGNGFALFQHRAEIVVDGKEATIFPGPADEFVVTEYSPVRAIVSLKGPYTTATGEFPGEELAKVSMKIAGREYRPPERPRYETQFTVYPTGRIFIRHVLEVRSRPLEFKSSRMLLATAPAAHVDAFNDQAARELRFVMPSSFIVHAGTEPAFPANALFVVNLHQYPTDWLGQMMMFDDKRSGLPAEASAKVGWTRSAFRVHGERTVAPGKYVWNFMLQIAPGNIRTREAAEVHALDYLQAARLVFTPGMGGAELADDQDEQLDGFVESRGAYVLSADGKDAVEFRMDCGMQSRTCPAFEIRTWRHPPPAAIVVDGARRFAGTHFQANVERNTLVLQYLGVFTPGEHTLRIEADAPEAASSERP